MPQRFGCGADLELHLPYIVITVAVCMSGVSQFLLKRSPRTPAKGRRRGGTRQCSAWCQHGSRGRAVVGIFPGRTHAVGGGGGGGDGVAAAQRLVCKAHGVDFGSVSLKRGRHAGQ